MMTPPARPARNDALDAQDRRILDRLQHGLPLVACPWAALADELGIAAPRLRERVAHFLDTGLLTRFGPMFDIERLGGAFTLAAMAVPRERFDAVAALLDAMPQVAHNYERDHHFNMWFVLGCEDPAEIQATLDEITRRTGLDVLNLPKEETYHVGLHLSV